MALTISVDATHTLEADADVVVVLIACERLEDSWVSIPRVAIHVHCLVVTKQHMHLPTSTLGLALKPLQE